MTDRPFPVRSIAIGDRPAAWIQAGFAVTGNRLTIGATAIELIGDQATRGIGSVTVDGLSTDIDGLRFDGTADSAPTVGEHANNVVGLDHLVATSPDMDRTHTALVKRGVTHRRTRTFPVDGGTRRQEFFWLGDIILELVGDDDAHGPGPAMLWGLALTCADLDAAANALGELLGPMKNAVQPGRQIATMRTRALDISVPIALLSPHR